MGSLVKTKKERLQDDILGQHAQGDSRPLMEGKFLVKMNIEILKWPQSDVLVSCHTTAWKCIMLQQTNRTVVPATSSLRQLHALGSR